MKEKRKKKEKGLEQGFVVEMRRRGQKDIKKIAGRGSLGETERGKRISAEHNCIVFFNRLAIPKYNIPE